MRAPASANALLSVRVTTTFGWSATSFRRALAAELDVGLVDDDEGVDAPRRARASPRSAARCRSGCSASRRTRRRGRPPRPRRSAVGDREAAPTSLSETSVRDVSVESLECSRYVGSNTTAVRPGPPYASSSSVRISFDPFAAHVPSKGCPTWAARSSRSRVICPSGYRFNGRSRTVRARSSENPSGSGTGHSFVLRRTATGGCGETYGSTSRTPGRGSDGHDPPPRTSIARA